MPPDRGRLGDREAREWRLGRWLCWGGEGATIANPSGLRGGDVEGYVKVLAVAIGGGGGAHPIVGESALSNPGDGGTDGGFAGGGAMVLRLPIIPGCAAAMWSKNPMPMGEGHNDPMTAWHWLGGSCRRPMLTSTVGGQRHRMT